MTKLCKYLSSGSIQNCRH